ncbi:MAG: hypothetical protein Q9219_003748 [cf. Caloplaca sp. 3 TL-2023]
MAKGSQTTRPVARKNNPFSGGRSKEATSGKLRPKTMDSSRRKDAACVKTGSAMNQDCFSQSVASHSRTENRTFYDDPVSVRQWAAETDPNTTVDFADYLAIQGNTPLSPVAQELDWSLDPGTSQGEAGFYPAFNLGEALSQPAGPLDGQDPMRRVHAYTGSASSPGSTSPTPSSAASCQGQASVAIRKRRQSSSPKAEMMKKSKSNSSARPLNSVASQGKPSQTMQMVFQQQKAAIKARMEALHPTDTLALEQIYADYAILRTMAMDISSKDPTRPAH